jgi:hypothetical protein
MDTAKRAQRQKRLVFAVRGGGEGIEELLRGDARALDADAVEWDALVGALDAWRADTPLDENRQRVLL